MEKSLKKINGDNVLEIKDNQPVTRRFFEKEELARKQYLEESIAHFQAQLDIVNANLQQIEDEKILKA